MSTKIISQAIIHHPEELDAQISIVKAEIDKQNATRNAQHDALVLSPSPLFASSLPFFLTPSFLTAETMENQTVNTTNI